MPDKQKQQQGRQTRRQFLKVVAVGSGAVATGAALPAVSYTNLTLPPRCSV